MNSTELAGKRLSGGARGLLNDLVLLNDKTTQEMARGIAESYLDRDGAIALAEQLGIEPPRIKKRFYRYFTQTEMYSVAIEAYTAEEADIEAKRMQDVNAAHGDIHYGSRSRFNTDGGSIRLVHSTMFSERPKVEDVPNIHPFYIERAEAEVAGQARPTFNHRINWNTTVPR